MDTKVLNRAAQAFLSRYPGGFEHPEMVAIGKKHKMGQLTDFAKASFSKPCFDQPDAVIENIGKLVSRSSMVSMFEKPKFKRAVASLSKKERARWAQDVFELLHGKEKAGFEAFVSDLAERQLAKWTLATVVQSYFRPKKDVFIKPSTAKLVVDKLKLDLEYRPAPSWSFYRGFRSRIKEAKAAVGENLAPNNAAFCGFLMTTLADL